MKKVVSILFVLVIVFSFVSQAFAEESILNFPDVIPESIVYEGNGDSVIRINHPDGLYVLYIKGNADSRFFAVKGYNSEGEKTELFVNTTDVYEGITIDPSQSTEILEISANGAWRIEVRSLWTCDVIYDTSTYTGKGDSIVLANFYASLAQIEGNKDGHFFAVRSYGERKNLMVNTTDVYSGTVMMKYKPFLLEIHATGDWSITLN